MKKAVVFCISIVLLCSMLAGCGNGSKSDDDQVNSNGSNTETEEKDISFPLEEKYTVKAFAFSNTGQELGNTLTMKAMEEKTNIQFDFSYATQADLAERRNLSFNGGDYADVYLRSGIDANETYKYGKQGVIIPLNDLIDQYMPNLKKCLDEDDIWQDITSSDGNIYALPQLNHQELSAAATYINTEWLDELGLEMPKTKEELFEVLEAFRDKDPNGNGEQDEYPIYAPQGAVEMLMPAFGIAIDSNTMSTYDNNKEEMTFVPTSEEYKEFLEFMSEVYKNKLINQDCYTATWDDINAVGAQPDEKIGIMATYGPYQHVGAERSKHYEGLIPLDGKHSILAGKGVGYGGLAITDKCENPEVICAWADYFYSEEGGNLGRLGVEGETYTVDEEGKYHWVTDGEYGEDITNIRNTQTMFGWYPVPLAKSKLSHEGESDPQELFLQTQRDNLFQYAADPFPVLSWSAEELSERADIITTLKTAVDEYQAQVVTGQIDLDSSWDKYVKELENMGLERLKEIDAAAYKQTLDVKK